MKTEDVYYKIQACIGGEWTTVGIGSTVNCAREPVRKFPRLNIVNFEHRIVKVFKKEEVVE